MDALRRRDLVGVLAWIVSAMATFGVLGLLLPSAEGTPETSAIVTLAASVGLAGVLVACRDDPPRWLGDLGLVWIEVGILGAIATATEPGPAGFLHLLLVWVSVLSFGFLPRWRAWVHTTGVTAVASLIWLGTGSTVPEAGIAAAMLLGTLAGIGLLFANLVDEARERAHTDDLTGVSNRRGILAALDDAGRTAAATGDPLSLLVLDLDGFKDVNDRDGHAAGDALLRAACDAWRGVLREGDHIGRIGGDEFVVVAPDADEAGAAVLADRMRAATPGGITVSIGTAALGRGEAPTAALRRADIALYAEKGRTADPPRRRTTD